MVHQHLIVEVRRLVAVAFLHPPFRIEPERLEDGAEVAAVVKLANDKNTAVVPVSGNTNLAAAATAEGAVMISLERMNAIREIRPEAKLAIVEAGVVLATLREAVEQHGLTDRMGGEGWG